MAFAISPQPPPSSLAVPTKPDRADDPHHHHLRLLQLVNDCSDISHLKQIHARALRTAAATAHDPQAHFLHSRILHASSSLSIDYARRVFRQVENPNAFMWNALIRACAQSGDRKEETVSLLRGMLEDGSVSPDQYTFPFALKACAYLFALSEGKQVHAQVLKRGLGPDVYVNNSLVHFYASCGVLEDAKKVFEKMPERTAVSWNAVIDALVRFGEFSAAMGLFHEMQKLFEPDGYTMQSILSACAGLGSLSLGMWAHAYILRKCDKDVVDDILVKSSLVDMYCRCGSLGMAEQIFRRMEKHNVNSWNSMILGFAMHGQAETALDYFAQMVMEEGLMPNSVTFVGVLSACNHKGMVDEGRSNFDKMINEYSIEPQLEHYGCLVDLLARAGLIDEALDLVSTMPFKPDPVIWRSILDACCKTNARVELSEEVAKQILASGGDSCSGVYVLLSKVYASASRWDDVALIRKLMTDRGVTKEPGCSLVEIYGVSHEFFAGDITHPQTEDIYQALKEVEEKLESAGYVPDVSQASMINDEHSEEKEQSLRLHSERLAIAFGLLNRKQGTPIRVFKNLRVCNDCHKVTKLISKIYNVEIIVRDRTRFHHFKHGCCSCMDYW
ncbi:pentatricopeptide repeat-containing protein At1g59720, chloroplastic/mitochondrial [Eucalyptus grandis]|uniref:pentatricopeptide repeat-containing protein At1g59720, chloroplastic/mitochondrial n=1 Tax=Eucalyptus grandis TaxID=71139 RepID=UPI00192E8013|nr:pentatricopeptide repeat-containing protein At1g59720, chloroplastic/mitochondrial [Eucalyptus grandis]